MYERSVDGNRGPLQGHGWDIAMYDELMTRWGTHPLRKRVASCLLRVGNRDNSSADGNEMADPHPRVS
eukprot:18011-Eustigmatos_ZCMA.PRE.1